MVMIVSKQTSETTIRRYGNDCLQAGE